MDEIFIKMCAASDEIQSKFTNEIGNLVFSARLQMHNLKEPAILMVGRDALPFCHGDIWLPRQEQLQKILAESPFEQLADVWELFFLDENGVPKGAEKPRYGDSFTSFEQLWLALVMWKKYHKLWDKNKGAWFKVKAK